MKNEARDEKKELKITKMTLRAPEMLEDRIAPVGTGGGQSQPSDAAPSANCR